jgi:hypothetical protein
MLGGGTVIQKEAAFRGGLFLYFIPPFMRAANALRPMIASDCFQRQLMGSKGISPWLPEALFLLADCPA